MQIYYSRLVCLLLIFAFVLIHARNIRLDFNDQLDDVYDINEQRRDVYFHKPSPLFVKKFFNTFANDRYPYISYEHEQLPLIARRAKAIIKGDPREFMG